jgi:hypothetical protein
LVSVGTEVENEVVSQASRLGLGEMKEQWNR